MNRRYRKNLMYGVVWTWSKAMDYADANATTLSNQFSQKIWNYGEAGFDHTHIFRVFWNYNFPKASRLANANSSGARSMPEGAVPRGGYNIFNHTNFSGVDTAAKFDAAGGQTNKTFGQYSGAQLPRRLQLALRLTF